MDHGVFDIFLIYFTYYELLLFFKYYLLIRNIEYFKINPMFNYYFMILYCLFLRNIVCQPEIHY
jgi:hypothetical protein